ncbi:uncharacterized protein METZ01_LOCUS490687 [marine metagenome]|uniref:Uncharacterized protein n=1 Tax=marine metagenome TaxID=408172 RepID=A0A383D0P8_9ZZZZ
MNKTVGQPCWHPPRIVSLFKGWINLKNIFMIDHFQKSGFKVCRMSNKQRVNGGELWSETSLD